GGVLMPRTAVAPAATLEQLIDRGRAQGRLSLAELRDAFAQAGVSPAEGRSILRELTDSGVELAADDEPAPAPRKKAARKPAAKRSTRKPSRSKTTDSKPSEAKDEIESDVSDEDLQLDPEDADLDSETLDLDDTQSAMGDSVHTYLKSIGRRTLLTAAEEVALARRIEAGLYAE